MAQYDNLKDYFHGEHLELITNAVKDYLKHDEKSDCQVCAPSVRSLVCTNDDALFNVEYEIGVSAGIVGDNETCNRSFIITITGNLDRRLDDIKVVRVKNISENDFPEDNILSQYILPDLPESEVERIGSEMFLAYQKRGVFDDCQLSLERIIQKEPIFFSPLPDNCLGRIILTDDDVEIFYKDDAEQIKCKKYHATPGTILLNKLKYFDAIDGSLMITIAHELAHWWFHKRFFKVLLLLGEESVDLISSTDIATQNDSTSDIQKALSIAEVQADVLAMRLAIPQSTVEATIAEIANDPSTHYENFGDRMQACVNKFAKLYSVSPFVAKERLRQLGYDFVDGTCLEYEENGSVKRPAPFYFQPGTLNENETFVIYPEDYERLLRENKSFAELIKSRAYIYTGYVICKNDVQYISPKCSNDRIDFFLSDYAREHADECCLKLEYSFKAERQANCNYQISHYLCKLHTSREYGEEDDEGNYTLSKKAICDMNVFFSEKYEVQKILKDMEDKGINSLYDALQYHKKRKKLTYDNMAERSLLPLDTIKGYFAKPDGDKHREISLERLMIICNALELEEIIALDLINIAGLSLNERVLQGQVYRYLLSITNATLEAWNQILSINNLSQLN